jgi:hypothetical protein
MVDMVHTDLPFLKHFLQFFCLIFWGENCFLHLEHLRDVDLTQIEQCLLTLSLTTFLPHFLHCNLVMFFIYFLNLDPQLPVGLG